MITKTLGKKYYSGEVMDDIEEGTTSKYVSSNVDIDQCGWIMFNN